MQRDGPKSQPALPLIMIKNKARQTSATGHGGVSGDLTCVAEPLFSAMHSGQLPWDHRHSSFSSLEDLQIKSIIESPCKILRCSHAWTELVCVKKEISSCPHQQHL